MSRLTWPQERQGPQQFRNKGTHVAESVRRCEQDNDRQIAVWNVLLEGKVAVGRDEGVEPLRRQVEKLSIGFALPTHASYSALFMTMQIARQAMVNAFVQ
jgi:hypothetical protein